MEVLGLFIRVLKKIENPRFKNSNRMNTHLWLTLVIIIIGLRNVFDNYLKRICRRRGIESLSLFSIGLSANQFDYDIREKVKSEQFAWLGKYILIQNIFRTLYVIMLVILLLSAFI